jgi:flagellar biosynthesis activator protein FlaF
MANLHYTEMLQDDQKDARERERVALNRSISMMERAALPDTSPAERANAIVFTTKLWTVLIEDLAAPDNGLPRELRAQIVSIGIWILRELEKVRSEESQQFSDVIEVSKAIRDGLL